MCSFTFRSVFHTLSKTFSKSTHGAKVFFFSWKASFISWVMYITWSSVDLCCLNSAYWRSSKPFSILVLTNLQAAFLYSLVDWWVCSCFWAVGALSFFRTGIRTASFYPLGMIPFFNCIWGFLAVSFSSFFPNPISVSLVIYLAFGDFLFLSEWSASSIACMINFEVNCPSGAPCRKS